VGDATRGEEAAEEVRDGWTNADAMEAEHRKRERDSADILIMTIFVCSGNNG